MSTYPAPAARPSGNMGCGLAQAPRFSAVGRSTGPAADLNSIAELLLGTLGVSCGPLTSSELRSGLPMELTPVTHTWTTMPTSRWSVLAA